MSQITERPSLTPAGRRILDAANRLFYERGITAVGVELIAEEAGTTKKTLYDRFGSKDGLVVAYLEARFERWRSHVIDHLASSPATGTDRILAVLDASEAWLSRGSRGCGFINAHAELAGRSPAAVVVVHAETAWTRELYVGLLREAGVAAPQELGRQLALVHEGATVAVTAGDSPTALDDARAVVRALLG